MYYRLKLDFFLVFLFFAALLGKMKEKKSTIFFLFRPHIVNINDLFPSNNVRLLSKLYQFISIVIEKANPPA